MLPPAMWADVILSECSTHPKHFHIRKRLVPKQFSCTETWGSTPKQWGEENHFSCQFGCFAVVFLQCNCLPPASLHSPSTHVSVLPSQTSVETISVHSNCHKQAQCWFVDMIGDDVEISYSPCALQWRQHAATHRHLWVTMWFKIWLEQKRPRPFQRVERGILCSVST